MTTTNSKDTAMAAIEQYATDAYRSGYRHGVEDTLQGLTEYARDKLLAFAAEPEPKPEPEPAPAVDDLKPLPPYLQRTLDCIRRSPGTTAQQLKHAGLGGNAPYRLVERGLVQKRGPQFFANEADHG